MEHANEQTSDYRRPNELRETTAARSSPLADRSPDIGALGYWSIGVYIAVLEYCNMEYCSHDGCSESLICLGGNRNIRNTFDYRVAALIIELIIECCLLFNPFFPMTSRVSELPTSKSTLETIEYI